MAQRLRVGDYAQYVRLLLWGCGVSGAAAAVLVVQSGIILDGTATALLAPAADRAATAIQQQQALAQRAMESLLPPLTKTEQQYQSADHSFPESIPEIEKRLWSVIHLDPRVGHQVLYGGSDGSFVALRRIGLQHYQIIARKNREDVETRYRHRDAVRTELVDIAKDYDPRTRPWYRWAVKHGGPSRAPVFSDFVTKQVRQVLVQPIYRKNGSLQGAVLVDMGVATYAELLKRTLPDRSAVAYLVNEDRQVIGSVAHEKTTSDFDVPVPLSQSPVRAAWEASLRNANEREVTARRVTSQEGALWAIKRPIEGPYGAQWHVVVAVPERVVWITYVASLIHGPGLWLLNVLLLALLLIWYRVQQKVQTLKAVVSRATASWPAETQVASLSADLQEVADRVQSLNRQLRTDALTGVLNRPTFVAQVEAHQAALAAQPSLPGIRVVGFALLFVDLNGFKAINDTHGHDAGDRVLKDIARRLKQTIRREDAVSRFGGDEFVIYLHGVDQVDVVTHTKEKLRKVMEQPIKLATGSIVSVSGAIGVAIFPHDGRDFEMLARIADQRMYAAKRSRTSRDGQRNSTRTFIDTPAARDAVRVRRKRKRLSTAGNLATTRGRAARLNAQWKTGQAS